MADPSGWEGALEEVRKRLLSFGKGEETWRGADPEGRVAGWREVLLSDLERLEKRVRKLERWRRALEKSELFLDRYRRLFQVPPSVLEKGERDIQKLRELIERKRAETKVRGVKAPRGSRRSRQARAPGPVVRPSPAV